MEHTTTLEAHKLSVHQQIPLLQWSQSPATRLQPVSKLIINI
jgi:hypothetical protein